MLLTKKPTNFLVVGDGEPLLDQAIVGTPTNVIPGRLVKRSAANVIVVAGSGDTAVAFVGFEHTPSRYRPADIDTAYLQSALASLLMGSNFKLQAVLQTSQTVVAGDPLVPDTGGTVRKIISSDNRMCIVAMATEDVTTTGAVKRIEVKSKL